MFAGRFHAVGAKVLLTRYPFNARAVALGEANLQTSPVVLASGWRVPAAVFAPAAPHRVRSSELA
jgi:hypothetical protein